MTNSVSHRFAITVISTVLRGKSLAPGIIEFPRLIEQIRIISISRGKSEGRPQGAKRPTAGDEPREFTSRAKGGACPEWHLDKEILEKSARNKIRVHQCLPIVEKILEKPK